MKKDTFCLIAGICFFLHQAIHVIAVLKYFDSSYASNEVGPR